MRRLVTCFAFCVAVLAAVSCKTVKFSEKSAFTPTKYNYESVSEYIRSSALNEGQKQFFLAAANKIANTREEEIITAGTVKLRRQFLKVNDSTSLEYFVFEPRQVKKTGMFFLGNSMSILNIAEKLLQLSALTSTKIYVLNYRGFGKSEGSPSFKTQFADNQNFVGLQGQRFDFVIGYSLGSVFATYTAVDNDIKNLYLISPVSGTKEMISYGKKQKTKGVTALMRPFIKISVDDYLLDISNSQKVKNYNGRLTVFHGTEDHTLPYQMGRDVFNSYPSTNKEFISLEKGSHGAIFENNNWMMLAEKLK